jgi:hypothetical protein
MDPKKTLFWIGIVVAVLLSNCALYSVAGAAVDNPHHLESKFVEDGDYGNGVVAEGGGILLDITHAIHPQNVYDYKYFFPALKELELSFTEIYVNQTLYDVNGTTNFRFGLANNSSLLGFEIRYFGPDDHLDIHVMFPDNTTKEVFDDTIYNGTRWQFHYHNASEGNWTLTMITSQAANITLVAGEVECWDVSILNESEVLILCSPYQSYTVEERELALAYAARGGFLLISGEPGESIWGSNLNPVLTPLGIELNGSLCDPTNNTGTDYQPILSNFTDHPIAVRAQELGVEELIVRAGGALRITTPNANVVLKGDSDTTALPAYPEGSYPPFAATLMYEDGKIFVQGDSSPGPREWYQAIYEWFQETAFDTGAPANPYPSVSGTFNGTIRPSFNLTVSTLYTYPSPGTGGHTESMELYDSTTLIANGTWNGYEGDWHTLTLHNLTGESNVTLLKDWEYRCLIRTGSYPQIIHAPSEEVNGGTITCLSFEDANRIVHPDWIPALRLE